jgi:DNA polymerase III subunit gamma/tau
MVFYRKYRPQNINELDSEQVRDALFSVLSLPEVPHAFLFTGPKGLGKTSTARIIAKAVNCEEVARVPQGSQVPREEKNNKTRDTRTTRGTLQAIEPCNKCEQCISITNGTNLDILEIDAASNRGIDEIRDLRDKIKLTPVSARKKIYIIDEVHMLTTEAFNALLKTLEEPPSHAMFILCTTELEKVPSTILSRCFHIAFQPATKDDIARSFKRIAQGEKLTIDDAAVEEIAALADGGFRDAHKILEELVAMGEKKITSDLVEKRYKTLSNRQYVASFIEYLQKKDSKSAIEIIQKLIIHGIDIKQFLMQLTDYVHQLMLWKAGIENNNTLHGTDSKYQLNLNSIKANGDKWEVVDLRNLLILLNNAYLDMKYAILPQLPLELAIIDWIAVNNTPEPIAQDVTIATAANSGVTVASMRKQVGNLARVKALYGEQKQEEKPTESKAKDVRDFSLLNISNTEITKEWLANFWLVLIQEMKQYNHTIAGVLRSCQISQFDKKSLVIQTAYKFHKERLDDMKTREALEQVCKTLTGYTVKVEIMLNNKS